MADNNAGNAAGELLPPNTVVKIKGISARPELNNELGSIVSYMAERQRYQVTINNGISMLFKPDNIEKATSVEQIQFKLLQAKHQLTAKALEMKQAAITLYNDPQTKEKLIRMYTSISTRLPPGVKPEHVLGAVMFLTLLLIFFIGFMKTMLLCSVLALLPTVALPDIVDGKSPKEIASNFPNRWKENLSQMAGGRPISDKLNYASLAIMALLICNVLFASSSSSRPVAPPTPSYMPLDTEATISPTPSSMEETLKQYYKLGFEDATDGKDYGTSLPSEPPVSLLSSPPPRPVVDDIDYSYAPPPPPPQKKSKFNFSTIMALLTLARTGRELAQTPDGSFNLDLAIANAKNMEPWKMGIIGICVYRLLSVFF